MTDPDRLVFSRMGPLRVTVSGLRTGVHGVYVTSWLRHALAAGACEISIVKLNSTEHAGAEFDERVAVEFPDVRVGKEHPEGRGRHAFVSIGSPAIAAWTRFRVSRSAWPLHTVVVDEGIGSYGNVTTRRSALRREGTREPMATVRASARYAAQRVLADERWCLYRFVHGGWQLDDRLAAEFRRVRPSGALSDCVVFLTQPWVDRGLITESAYLQYLRQIAEEVIRAGVEFRIRPHPTERTSRYSGFHLLRSELPAELDPDVLSARLLLGETSTALLNLAAVHDVPAARVVGPLASLRSIELSRTQESLFGQFVPVVVGVSEIQGTVERSGR